MKNDKKFKLLAGLVSEFAEPGLTSQTKGILRAEIVDPLRDGFDDLEEEDQRLKAAREKAKLLERDKKVATSKRDYYLTSLKDKNKNYYDEFNKYLTGAANYKNAVDVMIKNINYYVGEMENKLKLKSFKPAGSGSQKENMDDYKETINIGKNVLKALGIMKFKDPGEGILKDIYDKKYNSIGEIKKDIHDINIKDIENEMMLLDDNKIVNEKTGYTNSLTVIDTTLDVNKIKSASKFSGYIKNFNDEATARVKAFQAVLPVLEIFKIAEIDYNKNYDNYERVAMEYSSARRQFNLTRKNISDTKEAIRERRMKEQENINKFQKTVDNQIRAILAKKGRISRGGFTIFPNNSNSARIADYKLEAKGNESAARRYRANLGKPSIPNSKFKKLNKEDQISMWEHANFYGDSGFNVDPRYHGRGIKVSKKIKVETDDLPYAITPENSVETAFDKAAYKGILSVMDDIIRNSESENPEIVRQRLMKQLPKARHPDPNVRKLRAGMMRKINKVKYNPGGDPNGGRKPCKKGGIPAGKMKAKKKMTWMDHVTKTAKANPGVPRNQIFKMASKTYNR